ncbi:MAG: lysozyme [Desulfobulbus sp.]|nr:lysozyme [Desulfobulbus sp.]
MARDLTQAVELIKSFEGILDGNPRTVNLDPYLCPAGYWTIGWGHVVLDPRGKQIKGAENKKQAFAIYPTGLPLAEAEVLLADDIRRFSAGVEKLLQVEISDARFCALLSFAYNVGIGALARSTLLRVINEGNPHKAPDQFLRWTKSGGKVLAGLKRRREAEVNLWQAEAV